MKRKMLVLISLTLLTAACATTTDSMDMGPATPGGMTDGEIAGLVQTANEGEAMQGEAARSRATSEEVRAFAQMMASDHGGANERLRTLLSSNNMTTMESAASRTLQDGSRRTIEALNTYSGRAFDREYMRSQVEMHQWLLSALDTTLIPSARNSGLRTLLQNQRTAVATHLDRARRIQSGL